MKPLALFLTHSPPRPSVSGDRIRTFHLMRELRAAGWRTSLFSLVANDEPAGVEATLGDAADSWVLVPRGVTRVQRAARLAGALVRRRPFQAGWFWSESAAVKSSAWLAEHPDAVVFVEQLFMYPYVPPGRLPMSVLDTQNLEAARIATMAAADSSRARRVVARLQVGPVRRFEQLAVARAGRVLAVSDEEAKAFERLAPGRVRLVPNGVDVAAAEPIGAPPPTSNLLYVGSMSYGPNIDAISYFVDAVTPHLRSPRLNLTIVGSNPDPSVHRAASRSRIPTTVSGFVPDVTVHYGRSRMMVVPLRHGGGTRLKILEALARGLPVVTTSAGCAGLGLSDAEVMVADAPAEFAAAIDRLVEDDELWTRLSITGRRFVEQHYDWATIGRTLATVMDELDAELRGARSAAAGRPMITPGERHGRDATEGGS